MKKVLLINPPESGMGEQSSAPLGLLYIAGVLQKYDIPVKVADGFLEGWKGIEEIIKNYRPGIIGITCHTYARARVLKIAKSAKAIFPEATVVVGGAHATIMAKQLLENYPFIDITAIGEADYVLREVCEKKDYSEIPGIAYRKNGRVVINSRRDVIADLDSIPFPAWNLLDLKRYPPDGRGTYRGIDLAKEPRISVIFSRGCVGDCNFCSNRLMWKKWRHRSPENMLEELELLNKTFGIRHFHFNDDCFSVNKKATIDLCRAITDKGLNIAFDIVTRTDCVDAEILQALKDAGCYRVCFGIETASPRLLKIMGKPINAKEQEEAIRLTNAFGIRTLALLIAGCVGETWETINETIDFLNRARPSAVGIANGLMLFPGTKLYEIAKKNGVIKDDFWLTDYAWKMYTLENSPLWLNIFSRALETRRKLSGSRLVDLIRNHRFVSRQIGHNVRNFLMKYGLVKQKTASRKYKIAWLLLLAMTCLCSTAAGEQVEIEKQARKREPVIKEEAKEKIYLHSDYEYSWISQGSRRGFWRIQSDRIAYLNNNLQAPYAEFTLYDRFGEDDYTLDLGSYLKLKSGYLQGAVGFGSDVDFIYKFKAYLEAEQKLFGNLSVNVNGRYLHYIPQDVSIFSPGLVYYFGDNYVNASYGLSLTEGRGLAHFGMARGNFALNKYLNLWLGSAVGERLYDIYTIKASDQFGYILFAGTDVNVHKNVRLTLGGSYSKEDPTFIKRSIYCGASVKF